MSEQDPRQPKPSDEAAPDEATARTRRPADEDDEAGPASDIAEEAQRRAAAGEARDDAPDYGSEGALGKPETGEW